jgi:hypothetical protein
MITVEAVVAVTVAVAAATVVVTMELPPTMYQ